jgi:TolB-like protein/tetratricopeptide (TPR) repeat protein
LSIFNELKRRNVFRVATAYIIVGWLLTEVSTTLLPTFGAPDWIAKTLIFIVALAFTPVLIFAWAFEMTPEGIKREKDVDRNASITSTTGKKLDYVTIAAVVIGIAFLGFSRVGTDIDAVVATEVVETVGTPSVAVLPFVNMSGNAENEYFSDGLTETLLHMLSQIPDLRVAARTSSFAFKGKDQDIRAIGLALNVAHVLEGSVQRAGDRVRITAQLIRASDGFHVWSENYDRTLDDIFGIQDEIADKVGTALSASLMGGRSTVIVGVGTANLKAYDLYLQSLSEKVKGSFGSLQNAEGMLKDALALDPEFYDAKVELADNYFRQWNTGSLEGIAPLEDALAFIGQVLEKQPDAVWATGLLYKLEMVWNLEKGNFQLALDSLSLLEEHVDANPGDQKSAAALADMLRKNNRLEDALGRQLTLVAYDPINALLHYKLAYNYFLLERWDEARASALRSLEIEPLQANVQNYLGWIDRRQGDVLGYLKNRLKAIEIDPKDHEFPGGISRYLYLLHLPDLANQFRSRVLAIAPSNPWAYQLNILHAHETGDLDGARQAAKKAIDDDIENRDGAYGRAIKYLIVDGLDTGTIVEVLAYLEVTAPGLLDSDAAGDKKHDFSRFFVLPAWYVTLPRDEFIRRLDEQWALRTKFGWEIEDNPYTHALDLAARGDVAASVNVLATEFFTEPVATHLRWETALHLPFFADVIKDPLVQSEMQRYRDEQEQLRIEVRDYLTNLN